MTGSLPLEPSDAQMRALLDAAGSYVREHIRTLPEQPSWDLEDFEPLVEALRAPPPATGVAFDHVLAQIAAAVPKSLNTAAPGYLAYIPGGGLFTAALADFIAAAVNRYVGLWFPSPALVQMETSVLRWLCDVFGYPRASQGILTSGGSMANFSAIVTARRARLGEDFLRGTIYVTEHTHHSVAKAAHIGGFPARNVRKVPAGNDLRMDIDTLHRLIKEDQRDGLEPFLVVASLGTTNTGAVDPIGAILPIARDEGLWVHADAAYGGFSFLTDRGRALFDGVTEADSITLDPHKGMFLPYGTGALLVRDAQALRAAHSVEEDAAYLQDLAAGESLPNFADLSPELSRDFRGLRVWLPLQVHGTDAFRDALDEKLDLTRYLFEQLRDEPALELPWEPELSVVAFRARGGSNEASRALLERINDSKRIFCSSTIIDDRFIVRACIVSHRTHLDRIEEAAGIIRAAARAL